jgi:AcrR family transcriptional regulator
MEAAPRSRVRNPWGQGAHLRKEIVAAAAELLEETRGEGAVTLRSVARRGGITAPSIYRHFSDQPARPGPSAASRAGQAKALGAGGGRIRRLRQRRRDRRLPRWDSSPGHSVACLRRRCIRYGASATARDTARRTLRRCARHGAAMGPGQAALFAGVGTWPGPPSGAWAVGETSRRRSRGPRRPRRRAGVALPGFTATEPAAMACNDHGRGRRRSLAGSTAFGPGRHTAAAGRSPHLQWRSSVAP